ncbi:hypothetical protein M431DRAFT_506763, partial [Trichoderma harzianum CBS 226.95]
MARLGRQSAERLALWYPIAADLVLFVANVSHRLSVKKKRRKTCRRTDLVSQRRRQSVSVSPPTLLMHLELATPYLLLASAV